MRASQSTSCNGCHDSTLLVSHNLDTAETNGIEAQSNLSIKCMGTVTSTFISTKRDTFGGELDRHNPLISTGILTQ